jgi:hypothetical protein
MERARGLGDGEVDTGQYRERVERRERGEREAERERVQSTEYREREGERERERDRNTELVTHTWANLIC